MRVLPGVAIPRIGIVSPRFTFSLVLSIDNFIRSPISNLLELSDTLRLIDFSLPIESTRVKSVRSGRTLFAIFIVTTKFPFESVVNELTLLSFM